MGEEQLKWQREHPFLARAAVLQKRGDWSWLKSCFKLRAWSSKQICWRCDAGRELPLSFAEMSEEAPWRAHRVNHETFLARARNQRAGLASPLFDIPGFRVEHIAIDLLHTGDLGVVSFAAGSLLFDELQELGRGANKTERLRRLNAELRNWNRAHHPKSTINELTEKMVKREGAAPMLRAKAAESRYVLPWLAELARSPRFRGKFEQIYYEDRAECMSSLAEFYRSLESSPWSPEATRDFGSRFLKKYGELHDRVRGRVGVQGPRPVIRDELGWRVKPKHHLFQHLIEEQLIELGNPREYWTYSDEGLMGAASVMAAASPAPRTVAEQIMRKLQILEGMHL